MVLNVVIQRRVNFVKNVITGGGGSIHCAHINLVLGFTAWQKRCLVQGQGTMFSLTQCGS